MWWMERGDFAPPPHSNNQSESADTAQSDCTGENIFEFSIIFLIFCVCCAETDQSEDSSSRAVGGDLGSEVMPNWNHEKVATFTDYTISSSVVPRNKGLCVINTVQETELCVCVLCTLQDTTMINACVFCLPRSNTVG